MAPDVGRQCLVLNLSKLVLMSETSSGASRPVDEMLSIIEIASARSIAELKTSETNRAELQTNFKVLDSKIASDLQNIINGDF